MRTTRHRRSFRAAALATLTALAMLFVPAAAMAQTSYTIHVSGQGGTLTGVQAIAPDGTAVTGQSAGAGAYTVTEGTPGPFTIVGSGTTTQQRTTQAVYSGETVSSSTYSSTLVLSLPAVMPSEVTAPTGIQLTAGAAQSVAVSVYNATYGPVSNGALVVLTPSSGLTATASGATQTQVGTSVYAATVGGTVYANLMSAVAGSYTLQLTSAGAKPISYGSIPVTVSSTTGVTSSGGGVPTSSSGPPSVGSSVTVGGAQGTVVLDQSFSAVGAQTLTTSNGALTLQVPAGAFGTSGTVQFEVVEFAAPAATQLLSSSHLAAYESSTGLGFDFVVKVNGTAVSSVSTPISALIHLSQTSAQYTNPAKVDLMSLGSGGSLSFLGGNWNGTALQVPLTALGGPDLLLQVAPTFPDVPQGFWARPNVDLMASKFVVNGFPDGTFQPQGNVTRAQFTAMLLRMLNIPVDTHATVTFQDVPQGAWYYGVVATAASDGIVQGYSATTFGPNDPITREQLVTMFVRAMLMRNWATPADAASGQQTMDNTFTDVNQVSSYALTDMQIAVAHGLVKGVTPTTIDPLGLTTRAQAATWVARLFRDFM